MRPEELRRILQNENGFNRRVNIPHINDMHGSVHAAVSRVVQDAPAKLQNGEDVEFSAFADKHDVLDILRDACLDEDNFDKLLDLTNGITDRITLEYRADPLKYDPMCVVSVPHDARQPMTAKETNLVKIPILHDAEKGFYIPSFYPVPDQDENAKELDVEQLLTSNEAFLKTSPARQTYFMMRTQPQPDGVTPELNTGRRQASNPLKDTLSMHYRKGRNSLNVLIDEDYVEFDVTTKRVHTTLQSDEPTDARQMERLAPQHFTAATQLMTATKAFRDTLRQAGAVLKRQFAKQDISFHDTLQKNPAELPNGFNTEMLNAQYNPRNDMPSY